MSTPARKYPEYLNEDVFRKSLVYHYHSDGIVIEKFDITPATAEGDNYMSDVFRIQVQFRQSPVTKIVEQISIVAKCMPTEGSRGPVIEELTVFEKEREMFINVLPQLSEIANNEFFAAKCFHATNVPERMLVFQDLKSLGFVMVNRQTGVDFDHCALIMKKIGKFHAASMKFSETNMDVINQYFNFNMFNPNVENPHNVISVVFEQGLETLIGEMENNWDQIEPHIVEKLKKLLPVYVPKLKACLTQNFTDGFKVLNHGDLWTSNMMFKYTSPSGQVEDVVFVDYQISYYTSPGVDLNYTLSNCPNLETRGRTEELIEIYHQSLSETLQSIGYSKIPSLDDVHHEIRRMEFFALVSVISVLPIVLMEKTDDFKPSFDNMVDEELAKRARKIQYSGKLYQAIVKPMLKQFDERKLLDL